MKETGQQVLFLRKLVPGGSEHSFGIHVAKLAGIPVKVVQRAGEILKQLEDSRGRSGAKVGKDENVQLSFSSSTIRCWSRFVKKSAPPTSTI